MTGIDVSATGAPATDAAPATGAPATGAATGAPATGAATGTPAAPPFIGCITPLPAGNMDDS